MRTSYNNCHPKIAESLQTGEHIKCRVWDSETKNYSIHTVIAYRPNDNYRYVTEECDAFINAEPVKQKVKSAKKILEILHKDGYKFNTYLFFNNNKRIFAFEMFNYCEKEPSKHYTWLPEWLEDEE